MKLARFLTCCSLLASVTVQAAEFSDVQLNKSSLVFGYKQMNVPLDGTFARFNITARFDPAKPASGSARIDIDLSSIDTGNSDADEEVLGALWFDTKRYPQAQFVSSSMKSLGGERYQAAGKLTIKGKTLDVIAPFTVKQQGDTASFDGALAIQRLDYAIGTGLWADLGTVANEVSIKFHFVARNK